MLSLSFWEDCTKLPLLGYYCAAYPLILAGMDDTYVEMRPVKDGEMMSTSDMQQQQEEEPLYMEMNPAALPPPPHLPAPPPPPPTEAPVSTLHPPPSDPAPIYATVQVTPPQDSSPGESLYYASRDMLLASKRH